MPDAKISALPSGTAAAGDEVPVNKAGTTTKVTAQGIAALASTLGGSRVKGLIGGNNATTPNTQYDLSADEVVLVNPSTGASVVRFATGALTNNISTAGPAVNGRDQAGAFSASSWIHFWFIWDGTTLATLSSASATAPTLPSGYTHRSYAGAVRFNASSAMLVTRFVGADGWLDAMAAVLSGGTSSTFAAVDCSAFIPPNSRLGHFVFRVSYASDVESDADLTVRETGSAGAGVLMTTGAFAPTDTQILPGHSGGSTPVSAAQSLDYKFTGATATAGGAGIFVAGYRMPNGG